MARYSYTAYGLRFDSAMPLPELQPAAPGHSDITIVDGDVPSSLPEASAHGIAWQAAPGRVLLSVKDVARYLIVDNREIRVERHPGTNDAEVRVFLLGSVLGALLHARKMLILHASAIDTARGAVLFMGRSGAGKSTLLGAFLQRGYAMLADDKAAIALDERNIPHVVPGFPRIRLTEDAATALRYPMDGGQRPASLEKCVLPVPRFQPDPRPVHAAYSLSVHNRSEIHLERLPPLDRFPVLHRHTYRRKLLHQTGARQAHFRLLAAVSSHVQVARIVRPDHLSRIDELATRIEEDLAR